MSSGKLKVTKCMFKSGTVLASGNVKVTSEGFKEKGCQIKHARWPADHMETDDAL